MLLHNHSSERVFAVQASVQVSSVFRHMIVPKEVLYKAFLGKGHGYVGIKTK